MSWFKIPYSEKVIKKEETTIKRKYGKSVKKFNEKKDIESMFVIDESDLDENNSIDRNKDFESDYDEGAE